MREQRVEVEPFALLELLECAGTVCADKHGFMTVKGYIARDREDIYLEMLADDTWVSVKVYDENGNSDILFTGIVTAGEIGVQNGVKTLEITIKTGSFLMDMEEHIRSFQHTGSTYDEILKSFERPYQKYGYIMEDGNGESIKGFLCQYQETDWQFAERVAKQCNTSLYPNYIGSGVKFYFGMPSGADRGKISLTEYALRQTEKGISYVGKLRELFDIGDTVNFNGKTLFVTKRITEYQKSEFYHTYTLAEQVEDREVSYNDKLTGVSLDAVVTGVKGTDVTISISRDENKAFSGSRCFSYATVYSSPDGSGWYCMPETGDCVRLYFPSNRESEAYVLSTVHLSAESSGRRSNPNNKSLMNKQGKEILFKPDSILITNNNGMSLELSDEDGISIISDKKIRFESDEAIEITSVKEKIDLISPEKISLKQGNTNMELSNKMVMKSTKVRLN
ncbi:MAG: phage late control D family protein [Lachnospiraceae bacterium]|nr:phage late control D family protein [Lachnospiraceae bacterium]